MIAILHRRVYFVVTGLAWGGLAALLGSRAFGDALWGGVLLSPAIGLWVGGLTQDPFEQHRGLRRALISLGSLYLAATLFGMALGVTAFVLRPGGGPSLLTLVTEHTVTVWWGVSVTGFLLFLWPLAYASHWFLEWRAGAWTT